MLIAVLIVIPIIAAVILLICMRFFILRCQKPKKSRKYFFFAWSLVGLCGFAIVGFVLFQIVWPINKLRDGGNTKVVRNPFYEAGNIRVWEQELCGAKIDPAQFPKKEEPDNGNPEMPSEEEPVMTDRETKTAEDTPVGGIEKKQDPEVVYNVTDFDVLNIFGKHAFGERITRIDIEWFTENYRRYLMDKPDIEDLGNVIGKTASDARSEITDFEETKNHNPDRLSALDYYRDCQNRFFLYIKDGDVNMLEQAAISAEGAAETEEVLVTGNYRSLFRYIRSGVDMFCVVLSYNQGICYSGTDADVKYRMGKLLFKPAVNLKKIGRQERFYSLCVSYVFLRDAFFSSTSENKYSVEIAYYFLLVCKNLASHMDEESARIICEEALTAFCMLEERGKLEEHSLTYQRYAKDAQKAKDYVEQLLSETVKTMDDVEEKP